MPAASAQTLDDFYSDAALDEIRLTIAPSDWQTFIANYQDNTYYPCDWQWRGISNAKPGDNASQRAHACNKYLASRSSAG